MNDTRRTAARPLQWTSRTTSRWSPASSTCRRSRRTWRRRAKRFTARRCLLRRQWCRAKAWVLCCSSRWAWAAGRCSAAPSKSPCGIVRGRRRGMWQDHRRLHRSAVVPKHTVRAWPLWLTLARRRRWWMRQQLPPRCALRSSRTVARQLVAKRFSRRGKEAEVRLQIPAATVRDTASCGYPPAFYS